MLSYVPLIDLSNAETTNESSTGWFPEEEPYVPTEADLRDMAKQQLIIDVMTAPKATQAEIAVMLDKIFGRVAA